MSLIDQINQIKCYKQIYQSGEKVIVIFEPVSEKTEVFKDNNGVSVYEGNIYWFFKKGNPKTKRYNECVKDMILSDEFIRFANEESAIEWMEDNSK